MSSFINKYAAFNPHRLMSRESGFPNPIGAGDAMAKSLYCGMRPIASWDCEQSGSLPTGGVFNLEYSPEGSLLVAACEKKSIQIFDPLTHQRVHSVIGAHSDCVNCVKFLDGRMFATCSDDTTIALWDVRQLNKKIRNLHGHSNWVKNIEFSVKDNLLVTSGLDGSIYTWDINSYTECNLVYHRVFHSSGLMRCRLSPDAQQMVMCTTGGLLVIIHDLNLCTLAQDLHGFKPNLYRLMQMSKQLIPIAASYDHLFNRKRRTNRVEFVSDFPEGNDAKVVSSLQIHPQGWSALSRNISHDDRSEWSCIHDIQADNVLSSKSVVDDTHVVPATSTPVRNSFLKRTHRRTRSRLSPLTRSADSPSTSASTTRHTTESSSNEEPLPTRNFYAPLDQDVPVALIRPGMQNDVWEASVTIRQQRMLQEMASRGQVVRNFNMQRIMGINTGITPPPALPIVQLVQSHSQGSYMRLVPRFSTFGPLTRLRDGTPSNSRTSTNNSEQLDMDMDESDSKLELESIPHTIRQNKDRLLYYLEETNEGKGFIKELCYSADGRIVCSPFGHGMRLLALNGNCSELSHCVEEAKGPKPMVEIGQSIGIHEDLVVSSKFSPRHHQLVTGCLAGKIVWYEPCSGESL